MAKQKKRGRSVSVQGYTYKRHGKRVHVPGYKRGKPN